MLEINQLHVRFRHVHALRGVTLTAARDEVLVLIGPNGAGKSTVLNTVAGLYKPDIGSVRMDGKELGCKPPSDVVRAGVTLVPQGRRLFGSMTVRENLELGAYTKNEPADIDKKIKQWSDFFPEIGQRLNVRASLLSGGQQQIVAIIRGLMSEPRMLMMDEPSIGLAPIIVKRIAEEIRRLNRKSGIGIVLVEQNVEFALMVADRVAILSQGQVVHISSPDALRNPSLLANYFFGSSID
ncbi:MAG: ABC transporter ATP-binding protein [Limnohabitans sp.]|nr:ABC transporter ATP-binding protein [Limnohabitans sp.]